MRDIFGSYGSTFDRNIRVAENCGSEDFEMDVVDGFSKPVKRIIWCDGLSFGHYPPTDSLVGFNVLYFNASSKPLMVNYQNKGECILWQ